MYFENFDLAALNIDFSRKITVIIAINLHTGYRVEYKQINALLVHC